MSARRRVLVLSWYSAASADSGERVRLRGILEELSESFDVTTVSFDTATSRHGAESSQWTSVHCPEDLQAAYGYPIRLRIRAALRGRSVHAVALNSSRRRAFVAGLINDLAPDAIIVNQLPPFLLVPEGWRHRVILDTHNAEYPRLIRQAERVTNPLFRLMLRSQARQAQILERIAAQSTNRIWVVSATDVVYFQALNARVVELVPNGARVSPVESARQDGPLGRPRLARLLFLGSLGYSANRRALFTFASEWSKATNRDWTLDVVGSGNLNVRLQRILDSDNRIRLVGRVADVSVEYLTHDALVVPITEAGGTRLKVVEAALYGLPIISTRIGVEGTGLSPGQSYLHVENVAQFSDAVAALVSSPAAIAEIARTAKVVAEELDWAKIGILARNSVSNAIGG